MANRSDHYQYKIIEIGLEPHKLNNFANEAGIARHIAEMVFDDEIIELRQNLLDEIYNIINDGSLTEHQQRVLTMCLNGYTQNEIAKELGCSQSAIHKALHGNLDYANNRKRYGGIVKKLQKLSRNNISISSILEKIEKHKNNNEND